jgi:RNA polymerase sigma factor (sigma-70 family)
MISRALTVMSDERLAQLAAKGSDPAFAVLYNRYSGTLFAYCRSITRNVDDGWDALQNAMIKVLVALRRAPERSAPIRPWLFCICHNEAVGVLRRRASAERVAGAAVCTVVAGADEEAFAREVVSEVVSDVQQLPTGQRAALVMRELADLRYDEIAVALETTEGNARQLVFAARAGLRDSRAGRGLPCESVRDQLSLADGRLLRRRSVRAHLRTCDGCREYASTMRRQPVRALSAWSPLAGYQLLESVFRAAGPALVQGGSSAFAPLAAKAAAATVVLAVGLGAADVATRTASPAPVKPSAVASASGRSSAVNETRSRLGNGRGTTAAVRPAVVTDHANVAARRVAVVQRSTTSRSNAGGPGTAARKPARSTEAQPQQSHNERSASPQPAARESTARQQADCNGSQPVRQQQAPAPQPRPVREEPEPVAPTTTTTTTRDVAFTGDPRGQHDTRPR